MCISGGSRLFGGGKKRPPAKPMTEEQKKKKKATLLQGQGGKDNSVSPTSSVSTGNAGYGGFDSFGNEPR